MNTVRFVLILFTALFLAHTAAAQGHDHRYATFANMELIRVTPPAKITYVEKTEDGYKIEYEAKDNTRVEFRHVIADKYSDIGSEIPKAAGKKGGLDGLYWIYYCIEDRHLYILPKFTNKPSP